jgi:hypothetical protein
MEKEHVQRVQQMQEARASTPLPFADKEPWQALKLAFVEPKMTKHGKLEEMTGGSLEGFTPH